MSDPSAFVGYGYAPDDHGEAILETVDVVAEAYSDVWHRRLSFVHYLADVEAEGDSDGVGESGVCGGVAYGEDVACGDVDHLVFDAEACCAVLEVAFVFGVVVVAEASGEHFVVGVFDASAEVDFLEFLFAAAWGVGEAGEYGGDDGLVVVFLSFLVHGFGVFGGVAVVGCGDEEFVGVDGEADGVVAVDVVPEAYAEAHVGWEVLVGHAVVVGYFGADVGEVYAGHDVGVGARYFEWFFEVEGDVGCEGVAFGVAVVVDLEAEVGVYVAECYGTGECL